MRIITINTNGIRAAERKGFFTWLAQQNADFVCIQETKAQPEQLTAPTFAPTGYHCHYHSAIKKAIVESPSIANNNPIILLKVWGFLI